ncbi:MAG: C40 family peptidase [Candidatus Harrisonbacteria bacterium]|nr:C40 family peptidase [Candidatus Harrisonbacteria bacterium]
MNENQEKILTIAHSLIGTPYKYAAKPEEIPQFLDCSSFTQYVYKHLGIEIPRSTILQAAQAGKEINVNPSTSSGQQISDLQIGDLLFFRGTKGHYDDELFPECEVYIGHVAMYIGNNKVIHGSSKKGVEETNLHEIIKEKGPVVMLKRIL